MIITIVVTLSGCSQGGQPGLGEVDDINGDVNNGVSEGTAAEILPANETDFLVSASNLQIHGNPDILPGVYFVDEPFMAFTPVRGGAAYNRLYELANGKVIMGFDTNRGGGRTVVMAVTSDDMINWSAPALVGGYDHLDVANLTFLQLENGDIIGAYRANDDLGNEPRRDGYYSSIRAAISKDGGTTWEEHSIIAEEVGIGGVYEPHLGWLDGKMAVFYANDSRNAVNQHMEQNIEFKIWDGEAWGEKMIASDGIQTASRDGMPVWDKTLDGSYVMVIEATNVPGHPFVIQMTSSNDGLDWSLPMWNIYVPNQRDKKAGAPYIVTLPDGRYAVSFQTDDDKERTGDAASYMKVMFSLDDKGHTWTEAFVPFLIPEEGSANWNSLFLRGDRLYAATGTAYPSPGIYLREAVLYPYNVPGKNLVNNGMFMFGNTQNWFFEMRGARYHFEFPAKRMENRAGNRFLTMTNNTDDDIALNQQIPGVPEGEYVFVIKAMGGARVSVRITQGSETVEFSFNTPEDVFMEFTQTGIMLQDGIATLSIVMVGGTGRDLSVDDIYLAAK